MPFMPGAQAQPRGLLDSGGGGVGLLDALAGNRNMLMNFGLGLLSGQGNSDAFEKAMLGATTGSRSDLLAQKEIASRREKLAQQQAYQALAKQYGLPAEVAGVPELASPAILSKIKPREQSFQEQMYARMNDEQKARYTNRLATGDSGDDYNMQVEQRKRQAEALGMKPNDPRFEAFVLTGHMPREEQQSLSATDKRAIFSAEDENAALEGTIASLNRAKELNDKTFTGYTAGARGWAGTSLSGVPGVNLAIDENAAAATREFEQIMSIEAINQMSAALKGATTDREMMEFKRLLADSSTPPKIRKNVIDRMLQVAQRKKAINDMRARDLRGGTYFKGGGSSPETPSEPPVNDQPTQPTAQEAIQELRRRGRL